MRGTPLDHLEELAEELIKEKPQESLIKAHMKAAGLKYTDDSCQRLEQVLDEIDRARSAGKVKLQKIKPETPKLHAKDL